MSEDYKIEEKSDGKVYVTDLKREKADQAATENMFINLGILVFWNYSYILAGIAHYFLLKRLVLSGPHTTMLGLTGLFAYMVLIAVFIKARDFIKPVGLSLFILACWLYEKYA